MLHVVLTKLECILQFSHSPGQWTVSCRTATPRDRTGRRPLHGNPAPTDANQGEDE
ncbi:protein of unknown function [Burkholderia multivorans]